MQQQLCPPPRASGTELLGFPAAHSRNNEAKTAATAAAGTAGLICSLLNCSIRKAQGQALQRHGRGSAAARYLYQQASSSSNCRCVLKPQKESSSCCSAADSQLQQSPLAAVSPY